MLRKILQPDDFFVILNNYVCLIYKERSRKHEEDVPFPSLSFLLDFSFCFPLNDFCFTSISKHYHFAFESVFNISAFYVISFDVEIIQTSGFRRSKANERSYKTHQKRILYDFQMARDPAPKPLFLLVLRQRIRTKMS